MIPAWKLRRELLRFREQILGVYGKITGKARTRAYDRNRAKNLIVTDGHINLTPKVAIVLIYQPHTVAASVLQMCDVLVNEGYAPLVISNTPLSAQDTQALADKSWRIVVRPNMGYDFGGYREGVMQLFDLDITPDELIIMNDSVWVIADIFGAFLTKIRAIGAGVTGNVTRQKNADIWIESYFFMINRDTFLSRAFQEYWRGYQLIDSKYVVIRQGERGFSVKMAAGGNTVKANANIEEFCARVSSLPNAALELGLEYINDEDPELVDVARSLVETPVKDDEWRQTVIAFVNKTLSERRMWISTFPILGHIEFSNPFIKKGRTAFATGWRHQFIKAIEAGHMAPLDPVLLGEIQEQNEKGVIEGPQWVNTDRKTI